MDLLRGLKDTSDFTYGANSMRLSAVTTVSVLVLPKWIFAGKNPGKQRQRVHDSVRKENGVHLITYVHL